MEVKTVTSILNILSSFEFQQ